VKDEKPTQTDLQHPLLTIVAAQDKNRTEHHAVPAAVVLQRVISCYAAMSGYKTAGFGPLSSCLLVLCW
jgi:hypothetical protein